MAAPLHRALVEAGRQLQREAERRAGAPLTRAAFLGTARGRAARPRFASGSAWRSSAGRRLGHVVTAEFDRPNPPGRAAGLLRGARGAGGPLSRGDRSRPCPAASSISTCPAFRCAILPTTPRSRDFLAREQIEQRVLVLNAAYDHAALRAAYAAGRELGATHLVFTHLDEVPQWGRLWDYLLDGALEPLFLATGPSLTGDCEEDVFDALVRRTLAGGASPDPANPPEDPQEDEAPEHRRYAMKFIFLTGGASGFVIAAATSLWLGRTPDRILFDGAVGCLAGALALSLVLAVSCLAASATPTWRASGRPHAAAAATATAAPPPSPRPRLASLSPDPMPVHVL